MRRPAAAIKSRALINGVMLNKLFCRRLRAEFWKNIHEPRAPRASARPVARKISLDRILSLTCDRQVSTCKLKYSPQFCDIKLFKVQLCDIKLLSLHHYRRADHRRKICGYFMKFRGNANLFLSLDGESIKKERITCPHQSSCCQCKLLRSENESSSDYINHVVDI